MNGKTLKFDLVVPEFFSGRLDTFLSKYQPAEMCMSRSKIKSLILLGQVFLGNKLVKDPSKKVRAFERVILSIPEPITQKIFPQDMKLKIIFEDEHLLVVDKPAGMVVHPGSGVYDSTLVNGLLHHCGESIAHVGSNDRPGIVHRIDKLTSGILVVAKTDKAYQNLIVQFANHTISRKYLALVWGKMKEPKFRRETSSLKYDVHDNVVRVVSQIGRHPNNRKMMAVVKRGGKLAISKFKEVNGFCLQKNLQASLLECELETGRTHQIRVHLSHIGNPIIGDPTYGNKQKALKQSSYEASAAVNFKRQALHAFYLRFIHPVLQEEIEFEVGLHEDFGNLLNEFYSLKQS